MRLVSPKPAHAFVCRKLQVVCCNTALATVQPVNQILLLYYSGRIFPKTRLELFIFSYLHYYLPVLGLLLTDYKNISG